MRLIIEAASVGQSFAQDPIGRPVLRMLETFDRETVFSPDIQRVMRRRFGEFVSALKRPHKKPPKRPSAPGFVATRSARATGHVFAPHSALGSPCSGCGHPLQTWFSVDIASIPALSARLPRRNVLAAPACFDCNARMFRHDFVVASSGKVKRSGGETCESVQHGLRPVDVSQ